jgi:acetyl esterase/lipase
METDPATVFDERDLRRARMLNHALCLLPRYHPGRRLNALMLNTLIRAGQRVFFKSHASRNVEISTISIGATQRRIPLRLLRDRKESRPDGIYLHFHGGAWVLGNARLDDKWNADIVRACNVSVACGDFHIAVDDRLEQAMEDAVVIMEWVLDHLQELQVEHVIIGGESSGAQLAASALVRLSAKRSLEPVAGFLSFCGAFDMEGSESLTAAGEQSLVIDARSAYRNLKRLTQGLEREGRSPELSPCNALLESMPPALFIAGALDPIIDDSRKMYDRWQALNGNAEIVVVPDAPHGFERFPTRLASRTKAYAQEWMKRRLG